VPGLKDSKLSHRAPLLAVGLVVALVAACGGAADGGDADAWSIGDDRPPVPETDSSDETPVAELPESRCDAVAEALVDHYAQGEELLDWGRWIGLWGAAEHVEELPDNIRPSDLTCEEYKERWERTLENLGALDAERESVDCPVVEGGGRCEVTVGQWKRCVVDLDSSTERYLAGVPKSCSEVDTDELKRDAKMLTCPMPGSCRPLAEECPRFFRTESERVGPHLPDCLPVDLPDKEIPEFPDSDASNG